ncbi:MAG: DUF4330 family protein [Clostridia bacterium]|nr:DUF4330 family protein [Clostridia bacterium]
MTKRRSKIGFSVLDMFLLLLAAVCVLSFVFRDQLRVFLSGDEGVKIEYTFLIQNASEKSRNCPSVGEELLLSKDLSSMGVLTQVTQMEKEYHGSDDEGDVVKIKTLTCNATATARLSDRGYVLGNAVVKPGAELIAETENASFTMIVTMVKNVEE